LAADAQLGQEERRAQRALLPVAEDLRDVVRAAVGIERQADDRLALARTPDHGDPGRIRRQRRELLGDGTSQLDGDDLRAELALREADLLGVELPQRGVEQRGAAPVVDVAEDHVEVLGEVSAVAQLGEPREQLTPLGVVAQRGVARGGLRPPLHHHVEGAELRCSGRCRRRLAGEDRHERGTPCAVRVERGGDGAGQPVVVDRR
jgi:hypothetical protein